MVRVWKYNLRNGIQISIETVVKCPSQKMEDTISGARMNQ